MEEGLGQYLVLGDAACSSSKAPLPGGNPAIVLAAPNVAITTTLASDEVKLVFQA